MALGSLEFGSQEADAFYDGDGTRSVELTDFLGFRQTFSTTTNDVAYNSIYDFDDGGDIDLRDFLFFRRAFARTLDFD